VLHNFQISLGPRGSLLVFSLVELVVLMGVMALLEENQSLGREDCHVPIFGLPSYTVGDDFWGLC
jgi:hypothetical protein